MNRHPRRLLFLFSDTGGGHRSPAYAVAHALRDLYDGQAQIELVDALADYAPWPFNRLDRFYPSMVRLKGWLWAAGYHLSDGPRRVALLTGGCWPWVRAAILRLMRDHPADVIVCFHPIFNHLVLQTLTQTGAKTPLITQVIDLATAHAFWFVPGITLCLVPTGENRRWALARGLPAERVLVTGLPVGPRFVTAAQEDPYAVRRRLGLKTDLPTVLLVGGAEGMGPLRHISKAVAGSGVQAQLVVITGRNERLRARLSAETWPFPVQVKGFVHNMHEWMRAADLLVTKAGPSTVSEALVLGLPMVLSGALPGQERPTVDYVVQAGAGVWAPTPGRVTRAVRELLAPNSPALARMAARARTLARPDAAWRVAKVVWAAANGELAR
jgi:1,2-diacylglycerol 3-beta-galactosyltransferase